MEIIVYAEKFINGNWDVWEHTCSPMEVEILVDSVRTRAHNRPSNCKPTHDDFLQSARHIFDIARGVPANPQEGETHVYCVCVGHLVIGVYEKITQYSQRLAMSHELVDAPLRMSA